MADFDSQESTSDLTESPELTSETQQTEDHSNQSQTEANPFWGEVEKLTGPNVYKLIQPHLAKADTAARERIEALNQKLSPWSEFESQGIAPQHVKQALGVVQQLNSNPEQVFESLRTFLEREGRMPSQTELKKEVADDEAERAEVDPRDKELAELRQQQSQIQEFLQRQQFEQQQAIANQEADQWLTGEVTRIKQAGNYDDADLQEIIRIAAFQAQQTGQDPESLDAAAAQFNAMRDRIRTTPRPGQTAPRLPMGPGGGSPQGNVDTSKLSKADRLELVSTMLSKGKQ